MLSNKVLYKLQIWSTKYLPIILALLYLANTIAAYFNYELAIAAMLGGMSLLPLSKLYLDSWTYKLCTHHRIFIYYIFIEDILECIDYYTEGKLISDSEMFLSDAILFSIALFVYIILKRRYDFSRKHSS